MVMERTYPFPDEPFQPDLIERVHNLARAAMREIGAPLDPGPGHGVTPEAAQAQRVAFKSLGITWQEVTQTEYRTRAMKSIQEHGWRLGHIFVLSHDWEEFERVNVW